MAILSKRGFIQIPILIAILISAALFGGGGYLISREMSKPPSITQKGDIIINPNNQATSTIPIVTAGDIATTTIELDKNNLVISSLQKQVSNLTKKVNQPKVEETKIPSTTEVSKAVVTPTISVSTNPATKCLDPKKKWDDFIKSISEINTKYLSLHSSYNQGTENTPQDTVTSFSSYKYNLALSARAKFLSDSSNIRKMLETIPSPPLPETTSSTTYLSVAQIRTNYLNSLDYMESAYDIKLSGFKVIAEDENGISNSDIQTATALLKDSLKNYESSGSEFTKNNTAIALLKLAMNAEYSSKGCYFTFGTDNTARTTIKEEQNFSQAQPSVSANSNYTQATVVLLTNLPIEITEDSKTKTVMQLKCAEKIIGVQKTNQISVYAEVNKALIPGNKCVFTYSGSGNAISSLTATLPW